MTKYFTRVSRSNTGTVERLRMERILREQNERSRRDRMMAERAKKGTVRAARDPEHPRPPARRPNTHFSVFTAVFGPQPVYYIGK